VATSPSDAGHEAEARSLWHRIRRDVVLIAAGTGSAVLAQLIFRGVLVAQLVPAAYGRLSLVLSIYNTLWIIGAVGLPTGVSKYIAAIAPADDSAVVRASIKAAAGPTAIVAVVVATTAGIVLESPPAFILAAIGVVSLIYGTVAMAILRGRGHFGYSSFLIPIGGATEVAGLLILLASPLALTSASAFAVFCLGNVAALSVGIWLTRRTSPSRKAGAGQFPEQPSVRAPSARRLLGFSAWLAAATIGIAVLPLVVRVAAAASSYSTVAIVDVALVILSVPLRMGTVVLSAVVPHATRALGTGQVKLKAFSDREQAFVIVPFVIGAAIVTFTPVVEWIFDALGRPAYAESRDYLALALLAGPPRVLYGFVEGVLTAYGQGRFLAINSLSIAAVASVAILACATLGSMLLAFSMFVVASWAVYIWGLRRIHDLDPDVL
jgi:O-antigen/teichoic acid export membrane protein